MLHIHKLKIANLATHKSTDLNLPTKGLVAITGHNGAGKSVLLEAVSIGLWGESLRGELPWRSGEAGAVAVTTDSLTATRRRSKAGASKLEWAASDQEATTYETATKAQTALEAIIGPYDVWRRTCVLSSLDSAAFSLARDSDRKRLLEEFLGLSMFDTALDACRKDRRDAAAVAAKAESDRKEVALQLSFAQRQLEQIQKDQEALLSDTDGQDLPAIIQEGKRIAALVEAATKDAQAAQARVNKSEADKAALSAKVRHEQDRLSRLKDQCPTCGQNTAHAKEALAAEVAKLQREADAASTAIEEECAAARADLDDLQAEVKDLTVRLNKLREQSTLATSQAKQRALIDARLSLAKKAVFEWTAKAAAQQKDSGKAAEEAATLEAVEHVLGLRGVRAQVLDHALTALEKQANAWLSRMPTEAGPLSLTLAGSTTQKSGAVVDAISLKVQGRPYASCSGGERRRVDVAILLALRELAIAAHDRDGTLFCDEVFDALDHQGQADVASALQEMAKDRLVVVISHSPDLVSALRPNQHWHVTAKDGTASISLV